MGWDEYGDYESAKDRRARLERRIEGRREGGEAFVPVVCKVKRGLPASTFWGKSWCLNLEAYSDFESRLPRGRTYLRQGAVYDLVIDTGGVSAYVSGSEIYEVQILIETLPQEHWAAWKQSVAGEVRNLVDLLSGQLGDGVLRAVTDTESGLFPSPKEITLNCTCPDWADCCKHVAAVLYAVGVRLDEEPALFFRLRNVDHTELIEAASTNAPSLGAALASDDASGGVLAADELSDLFGIDLADPESAFP